MMLMMIVQNRENSPSVQGNGVCKRLQYLIFVSFFPLSCSLPCLIAPQPKLSRAPARRTCCDVDGGGDLFKRDVRRSDVTKTCAHGYVAAASVFSLPPSPSPCQKHIKFVGEKERELLTDRPTVVRWCVCMGCDGQIDRREQLLERQANKTNLVQPLQYRACERQSKKLPECVLRFNDKDQRS